MMGTGKKVIVIGGGPGGYVASIRAAQLGGQVTLVEKQDLGGTCLNRGCIPTKFLIHAAGLIWQSRAAQKIGITFGTPSIDFPTLMKEKEKTIKGLQAGISHLMKKNNIHVIRGVASIQGKGKVSVQSETKQDLKADVVIIATGSQPSELPGAIKTDVPPDTSDEALASQRFPRSVAIIGGGVIGIEFAQVYGRFNTQTTVIELMPNILPEEDPQISDLLSGELQKEGIAIFTGSKLLAVEGKTGQKTVRFESPDGPREIEVENVLSAVGRRPCLDGLGLEKSGIMLNPQGRISVDAYLETSVPGIYAIGDVLGTNMLAHVAMAEGIRAAENALTSPQKMDYRVVPRCVYSQPEVASVGLTEKQAKDRFGKVKIGHFPFAANSKSRISGETGGMVKVIADDRYDQVLGVSMVGPHATELIAEAALAVQMEATLAELSSTIHAHPTASESVMEAALNGELKGLHM